MIFIDRSIPRSVARALQAVRDDIVWLDDEFPIDTPDRVWIREVGARGWLVITRDKNIRTRLAERRAIIESNVGCFCLIQRRPLNRWGYLKILAATLDEMEGIFTRVPHPFIYGVRGDYAMAPLDLEALP
jgi:hypothetical protein